MSEPVLCPKCGEQMVIRYRKSDGSAFYGCPAFPDCKGTRPIAGQSMHREPVKPYGDGYGASVTDALASTARPVVDKLIQIAIQKPDSLNTNVNTVLMVARMCQEMMQYMAKFRPLDITWDTVDTMTAICEQDIAALRDNKRKIVANNAKTQKSRADRGKPETELDGPF